MGKLRADKIPIMLATIQFRTFEVACGSIFG
jgi:hypothetical protein